MPMIYQEVFGIRRYQCRYRHDHSAIWVNLNTGKRLTDIDVPYTETEWPGWPE